MSEEVQAAKSDTPDNVHMRWKTPEGHDMEVSIEEIENGYIICKELYRRGKEYEDMDWEERNIRKKYYSKEKPEILPDVDLDDFVI